MAALGRIHVLLVGIDVYQGVPSLFGCVNDVDAVRDVLVERLRVPEAWIRRLVSPRAERHETVAPENAPTLANITRELEALASDAVQPEDRVFIHYSGHGTQARLKVPDGTRIFREALVPCDTGEEQSLLFDWKLNQMLAAIAARTQKITFIIDSCCSAGATRAFSPQIDPAPIRSQERFVATGEIELAVLPTGLPAAERGVGKGSVSSCQVIAACEDDETAQERDENDRANGALTRAFVDALADIPDPELADLRWGSIWRPMLDRVRAASPRQHPWSSGGGRRFVFGGPPEEGDAGLRISKVGNVYRIDAGESAGITKDAVIGVYGPDPLVFAPIDSAEDRAHRRGELEVTLSELSSADAIARGEVPILEPTFRGRLIAAGEITKLRVAVVPRDEALVPLLESSPLLRVTAEHADVVVTRVGDTWAFVDDLFGDGNSGAPSFPKAPLADHAAVRRWLESYFEYAAPLRMARSSAGNGVALQIRLLDCAERTISVEEARDPQLSEAARGERFSYELPPRTRVCIEVRNVSALNLRTTLLVARASGEVDILGEKNSIRANGKHIFWLDEDVTTPFVTSIPPGFRAAVERLIAIGTTAEDKPLRFLEKKSTFREALGGEQRRAPEEMVSFETPAPRPIEEWRSALATVCTRM